MLYEDVERFMDLSPLFAAAIDAVLSSPSLVCRWMQVIQLA
jgi:hypothetical protein